MFLARGEASTGQLTLSRRSRNQTGPDFACANDPLSDRESRRTASQPFTREEWAVKGRDRLRRAFGAPLTAHSSRVLVQRSSSTAGCERKIIGWPTWMLVLEGRLG